MTEEKRFKYQNVGIVANLLVGKYLYIMFIESYDHFKQAVKLEWFAPDVQFFQQDRAR